MEEKLLEIKDSAISYLDRFQSEVPALVLELRTANTKKLRLLPDILEGTKWLFDAATAVSGKEADTDTYDRLFDALDAMGEALENLDYTLIADILEYEILELAVLWREIIEQK